ncbi:MAG TPA: hypothetical protein VM869_07635 [Enhygromyxa sp.]|nr:hypothetical protein [Enhygromyxa sp.]
MQYRSFVPDIETLGSGLMATLGAFGPLRAIAERVLVRDGLLDESGVQLNTWYPLQPCLDAMREIDERFGPEILFNIGAEIPNNVVFPTSVVDVHTAVASIDIAYHLNHRRAGRVMYDRETKQMIEGIGHYGYERLSDTHILSTCTTPWPCEFDLGIVATMIRRFEPRAIVEHVGSECRRQGASACTYSLRWG